MPLILEKEKAGALTYHLSGVPEGKTSVNPCSFSDMPSMTLVPISASE